jgi:S-adenosylmethionine decarboxylase
VVLDTLADLLGSFEVVERTLVRRGEDWPRDVEAAVRRWVGHRQRVSI